MATVEPIEPDIAPEGAGTFRAVPHNIEAEQALLGAILVNNDAADRVTGFLQPQHFFDPLHGRIYSTATKLIMAGKRATPVTLKTFFEHEAPIGDLKATLYLVRLAANATTIINAEDYGRTVYDLSVRRDLILIGEDMVNQAYDSPVDSSPSVQIEEAEQQLFELAETGKYGAGFEPFSEALTGAIDMAANAYKRDGHLSGISTGFNSLDEMMGGLQESDLVIIAGRPSMGKTAFATNIAYHIARAYKAERMPDGTDQVKDGAVVGFFSLEMSSEQLATRIIAEQASISSSDIRRGKIQRHEFDRLVTVAQEMETIPLFIDQTGGISVAQLAARARRLKRQHELGLIIVDYLQLLSGTSRRASEGRVQEITEITTNLKALAKELNVPIIALSQLSRQVEHRDDKRPQLADLRESGSIEQDADVVMFLYRQEYYLMREKPDEGFSGGDSDERSKHRQSMEDWQDNMDRVQNIAEVIIGKQRHGPIGTVELQFDAQFTRFSDLAKDRELPERRD